jgi:hypothetical protein
MTRRLATVILHWTCLILLLLLLASGGQSTALAWAFALCGGAMVVLAILRGLLNGPGRKLDGTLRAMHPWLSRVMYALLAWGSGVMLAAELGLALPGPQAKQVLFVLFGAGLLHGCFHLWRSSALNDGALRRMLP